jgi:RNase P protein component
MEYAIGARKTRAKTAMKGPMNHQPAHERRLARRLVRAGGAAAPARAATCGDVIVMKGPLQGCVTWLVTENVACLRKH